MPAYVIGTVEVPDPAALGRYVAAVRPVIERYGGRIRAAGPVTVLDGEAAPTAATLIEFASEVDAAVWFDSSEHWPFRTLPMSRGRASVLLVDAAHDPDAHGDSPWASRPHDRPMTDH